MELLTATEGEALAELEEVIERGLTTFVDVGNALLSIRDERLYRAEYATFEDYCRERWGLSQPRAYQLMDAAGVVSTMVESGLEPPTNERQVRELGRVPEERRAEVWQQTLDATGGKPTAAAIRQAYQPEPEPESEPELIPEPVDDPLPEPIAEQIDQRIAQRTAQAPEVWTPEETALRDKLESGQTIVVSMRGGHDRLIAWAEQNELYVRVDRRTEWGNPFETPADGDRETVIVNYRDHYLPYKPSLLGRIGRLHGKALGCWCAPEPCHGDVLAALAIVGGACTEGAPC